MDVIGSRADDTIDERMAKATEKLEADFSKLDTKISRFPHGMRGIGGQDGSFIEPSVVAIGPYHHGAPYLQKMEEVKLAAAYNLCRSSGHSRAEVFGKVLSVAGAARDCYDADDPAVMGVSDADFATMMFLDGCFLLHYMVAVGGDTDHVLHSPVVRRQILSMGESIHRDIFLLENQIPWLVLDALIGLVPVDVGRFVYRMRDKFEARRSAAVQGRERARGGNGNNVDLHYKPPHLLGLLRFTLVGRMPEPEVNIIHYIYDYDDYEQSSSRRAVELVKIGIALKARTKPWFGDMRVRRGTLTSELSLSPVFLNHVNACCLVNMAALEAAISTGGEGWNDEDDGLEVSSYLSVLAMLMEREEDVDLLQRIGLLHGSMGGMQALVFFKDLRHHLRPGGRHIAILKDMQSYVLHRPLRIAVRKFIYHNYYKIAAGIISITNIISSVCTVIQTFKSGSNK